VSTGATPAAELPAAVPGGDTGAAEGHYPSLPGETRLRYVPALDGIRAVSIIGIMANHNGLGWASGGFISVNVFFVLSGFLITSLILKEWLRSGTLSLRRFWARRARRLLPALFVLLVGIAVYAWFIAPTDTRSALRGDALSTLFYVGNWHQIIAGQSYFAQTSTPSPLLHTWTLAIEEQFYLVWPLVVLGVLKLFRSVRPLLVLTVVAAVGSAVEMALLFHPGADPSRLYYGTDTRAQDLLIGAVVAIALTHRGPAATPAGRRAMSWLVVGAALGFAAEWIRLNESSGFPYRGGFLLADVLVGVVILGVVQAPAGLPARVLGWRPLVYVGTISYGLYLWHWPVILVMTSARVGVVGWPLFLLRSAVAFVLAAASARFVELPIRAGAIRSWRAWVLTPLAAGLTAAVILLATTPVAEAEAPDPGTGLSPALHQQLVASGAFGDHPVRFMLLGDSMATTLGEGLYADDHPRWGIDPQFAYTALGCDLDPELQIRSSDAVGPATPGCKGWQQKWPTFVAKDKPQVVALLLGRWEVVDHYYEGQWTHIGEPLWDDHLEAQLDEAIGILSAGGAKVMLFTMPYVDPAEAPDGSTYPENQPARADAYNALVRKVAAGHPGTVTVWDLNKALDPDGHFTSTVDGLTVRWSDGIHISYSAGEWLRPQILPVVDSLALGVPNG
jgi:peptidoglycan/LPS O-acetylase OafA/YrhL